CFLFFFSSRRRHTRSLRDWSSDVCSSDLSSFFFRPIMPPAPIEGLVDVVEVGGSNPKRWSVDLQLWTKEEGRSDLTLQMHFTDRSEERRVGKECRSRCAPYQLKKKK